MIEDDDQRETCESICDFTTHFFCHPCALCQEGRQLRRKLPHPGFTTQPFLMTIPPAEQTMYRNAWFPSEQLDAIIQLLICEICKMCDYFYLLWIVILYIYVSLVNFVCVTWFVNLYYVSSINSVQKIIIILDR